MFHIEMALEIVFFNNSKSFIAYHTLRLLTEHNKNIHSSLKTGRSESTFFFIHQHYAYITYILYYNNALDSEKLRISISI